MKHEMGVLPAFYFNENLRGNFDDTRSAHCFYKFEQVEVTL